MKILLRIAWRNLKQNRAKTAIVGGLITMGIVVLVLGNSLMDTATQGIERSYIQNYTGHLMVSGRTPGRLTMFGFQDVTAWERAVPLIPRYEDVVDFLEEQPYVEVVSPQATANALVSFEEEAQTFIQLFGIDPVQYQKAFPDNLDFVSGGFFQSDEEGILLSQFSASRLSEDLGRDLEVGDQLLLTGMSPQAGMRIREVPIRGIFQFRQSNPQLEVVSLLDITNLRALNGMAVRRVSQEQLEEIGLGSFDRSDEDSLFGAPDDLLTEVEASRPAGDETYFDTILGEPAEALLEPDQDSGAWHFLLVRLLDQRYLREAESDLREFFAASGIDAQTSRWLEAAGAVAELSFGVRWIFNAIVFVIAIVAVIIIMNTLVISVTERMGEIGTMRAIGAQKGFVQRMIFMETLLVTALFGSLGIAVSAVVLAGLRWRGIEAPNVFFEVVFGGPVLYPQLSLASVGLSLLVILAVAGVSSLYPASIVMKMEPITAMQSE